MKKKKGLLKIKKMLPILVPMASMVILAMIVIFMNAHSLYLIKKVDEQLNENEKLEIIFENLDQKKELVNRREEMIDHLQAKSSLAYQLIEELPMKVDNVELIEVQYGEQTIRIVGHCASQEEIGEFCKNLNKIKGLGQAKIAHVTNLMTDENLNEKGSRLSWEFTVESQIKEKNEDSKKE